jgi:hypothetical protein
MDTVTIVSIGKSITIKDTAIITTTIINYH